MNRARVRTDRLERWSVAYPAEWEWMAPELRPGPHLRGFSERRQARIFTSRVVATSGRVATTESGTKYTLGAIEPQYAKWLAEQGITVDEAQPVKVLAVRR